MFQPFGPILWSPQYWCYFIDLIHFWIPQKQRLHHVHLSDDTTHGKDVNGSWISRKSEEKFGSSIPSGRAVLSEWRFGSDLFCNTEVNELDIEFLVDQEVLRFEISMKESLFVDVWEGLGHLPSDVPNLIVLQFFSFFASLCNQLVQVFLNVLKY